MSTPEWITSQLAARAADEDMTARRAAYDAWAARVAEDICWMISARNA